MKLVKVFTLAFFILVCSSACFAQVELKAEVDKQKISTDEGVVYKLLITAAGEPMPQPELPAFQDFNITAQVSTSNIEIAGNESKFTVLYIFVLAPKAAGKFVIESATAKAQAGVVSSGQFEIEVTQGKKKHGPPIKSSAERFTL